MHTTDHDTIPQPSTDQATLAIDRDDEALVILHKHTTLTEAEKCVLKIYTKA